MIPFLTFCPQVQCVQVLHAYFRRKNSERPRESTQRASEGFDFSSQDNLFKASKGLPLFSPRYRGWGMTSVAYNTYVHQPGMEDEHPRIIFCPSGF